MRSHVFLLLPVLLAPAAFSGDEAAVLRLGRSPHAKLHGVPVGAVKLGDGFWTPRMRVNVERSIPALLQLLEEHGVVDNFRRLAGTKKVARRGPLYTDSDLYKWMEAVAFVLQSGDRPELRRTFDHLAGEILAAQEPGGYLNTYWIEDRTSQRFQRMQTGHELYCLGHLLQAAIAYKRATGDRKLLDGGIRFAGYLVRDFGPGKRPLLTGHPELEMALVELYRETGNRDYLNLAGYLLSGVERERLNLRESEVRYMFSGKPFIDRTQFEGHAVRAMYASCGATDYYMETGDAAYRKTLDVLWEDMTRRKMYISGGVGSRAQGEAFGEPYELPNAQAYTESCAAIGNMMWNWRMLALTGGAKYADVIERALYNGINSGMSLDGTLYCYRNPLSSSGEKIRNPWYDTTCCPPNLQRVLASLPGYFYSTSAEGLWVHLYHSGELNWQLEDGTAVRVGQKTDYPWHGKVDFTVSPGKPSEFTLFVRIPAWSGEAAVSVNGRVAGKPAAGSYFPIRRTWRQGDGVALDLDMRTKLVAANPRVAENGGRAAVERGPLVYALEQPDQGANSVPDLILSRSAPFEPQSRPDLLGGIRILRHSGFVREQPASRGPLYEGLEDALLHRTKPASLVFVPYYTWANRGSSVMEVWIPYKP